MDSLIICDFLEIVYDSGTVLEVLTEAGHTIYVITMHSHNTDRYTLGFPGGSDGKESACNAGDPGSVLGQEDLLEKAMVTHSSVLAWSIPWTGDPGELQSMGWQRVEQD